MLRMTETVQTDADLVRSVVFRHAEHDLLVRLFQFDGIGCHCWLAQQSRNTGGQATRGTHK